jgi:hypothetical protein
VIKAQILNIKGVFSMTMSVDEIRILQKKLKRLPLSHTQNADIRLVVKLMLNVLVFFENPLILDGARASSATLSIIGAHYATAKFVTENKSTQTKKLPVDFKNISYTEDTFKKAFEYLDGQLQKQYGSFIKFDKENLQITFG